MGEKNPLIVALDVTTEENAVYLIKELKNYVSIFKVGPVLFTRYGPKIVRKIQDYGCGVFLDFKLYDIPNTVALTVEAMKELDIAMFTVHVAGGKEMLEAAAKVLGEGRRKPKMLGVTVLTSVKDVPLETVMERVELARKCGCDGVISSPLEVRNIREKVPPDFLIVTPGIRPYGAGTGDQKRAAVPKIAIQNGADYIVVGRPIIESERPRETAKQILSEISSL